MKRTISVLIVLVLMFALVPVAFAAEEKVYYYNSEGWESVGVYTWEPKELWGGWPGGKCTDEGDGWWSIVVPDYVDGNHIIFNGNGDQTADLVLKKGSNFFYGNKSTGPAAQGNGYTKAQAIEAFGAVPAAANPKTGDNSFIGLAICTLLASGGLAVIMFRRRRTEK